MNFNLNPLYSLETKTNTANACFDLKHTLYRAPLEIAALVFDWDGTAHRSYDNLLAVGHLHTALNHHASPDMAERFLDDLVAASGFQHILHRRKETRDFFAEFIRHHDLPLDDQFLRTTLSAAAEIQKRAYRLYPGFQKILNLAEVAEVPVIIYTKTSPSHLYGRQYLGGVNPEQFTAIYAHHADHHSPLETVEGGYARMRKQWVYAKAFADRLVPYSDYAKPSPRPIIEIKECLDIAFGQILVVGDGLKDAQIVFGDHDNPMGHFAFQAAGARDISEHVLRMDKRLRPKTEIAGLGYDNVVAALRSMGVGTEDYLHLDGGLEELADMMEDGRIGLIKPSRMAVVRHGQLVTAGQG